MGSLTHTVGGTDNLVNFKSAARVPIDSLKVHFSPIQEGEGDPSPENVRPITGWNEITTTRSEKNLFDALNATPTAPQQWTIEDGIWNTSYVGAGNGTRLWNNRIYAAGTYTISAKFDGSGTSGLRFICNSSTCGGTWNNVYQGYWINMINTANSAKLTFSATEPFKVGLVFLSVSNHTGEEGRAYDIQMELGSTATVYEPYRGEMIPVTFPVLGKNKFNPNCNWEIGKTYRYTYLPELEQDCNISFVLKDSTIDVSDISMGFSYYVPIIVAEANKGYRWCLSKGKIQSYEKINRVKDANDSNNLNKICKYLFIYPATDDAYNRLIAAYDIQIEFGSEATTYEPYNSDNTVYGGYVDLAKGEIVRAYGHYILNGSERWTLDGSGNNTRRVYRDTNILDGVAKPRGKLYCNYCRTNSSSVWYGWLSSTGTTVSCHILFYIPATIDTVDKWKAYLSENPLEIVYELAESIHYPLTPHQLTTFLNQNNFWSNTNGPTEVSYAIHDSESIRSARKRILAAAPNIEEASGGIATFDTDLSTSLKECRAYFEPIQDLHGYNNPWPAGGGRNIFHVTAQSQTSETGVVFTVNSDGSVKVVGNPSISTSLDLGTITLPAGTYKIQGGINNAAYLNIPSKVNSYGGAASFTIAEGGETITPRIYITANNEVNGTFYPMIKAESDNNADWAPYENICPIEGFNNINIYQTTNTLPFNVINNKTTNYGVTFTCDSTGKITANGIPTSWSTFRPIEIEVEGNEILYEKIFGDMTNIAITAPILIDSNNATIQTSFSDAVLSGGLNLSQYEDVTKVRIGIKRNLNNTLISGTCFIAITKNTPASVETIPITFPSEAGTVYGGYVDLVKGEIVAEYILLEKTWGEWGTKYEYDDGTEMKYINFNVPVKGNGLSNFKLSLCNVAPYSYANNNGKVHYYIVANSYNCRVYLPANTNENTNIQVLAELVTPIHYSLTPTQLKTLRNTNNIWSSANGDIEIKYWTH